MSAVTERTGRTGSGASEPGTSQPAATATRTAALLAALAAPAAMGVSGPALALPAAARDLHVADSTAAWLMTAYGLAMAAGTPLLSGIAGRRGPGRMLRLSGLLLVLGAAAVLLSRVLPAPLAVLLAGQVLGAAGAAGINVGAFQLAARDPSGRTAGAVAIGSAVGGTLGLFAGAAATRTVGWPAALLLPLIGLAVLPAALRLAGPPSPDALAPDGRDGLGALFPVDVLRDRGFRAAAALMFGVATVNFALLYGAPRRLGALTGWAAVPTGAAASLVALAGALSSWALIRSAGALGARRVRAVLAGGSLLAAALAAFAPWPAAVLVGSGLSALVTSGGQGLLTGAASGHLAPGRRPLAIGLFNLAFLGGVAAGPVAAVFADQTVQFIY
ncbi:MFS transporter [Streptomyces sp. NPDC089919]|uniref:MFS transporter n=1 Tax=Streptomyces sp. NPDC089919 TaxID=3155188 RepID=UPI00342CCDB4